MSNFDPITAKLKQEGITLAGSIIRDEITPNKYFIFVSIDRNENNLQQPSNKKLKSISEYFSRENYIVEFILIDNKHNNIESGLRATLLYWFGDVVRNAFVTIEEKFAYLWIVPKTTIKEKQLNEIKLRAGQNLNSFNLILKSVNLTTDFNLISKSACLSLLRTISPADIEAVSLAIKSRGFKIPSEDWLSRMLDNLRKNGLILRLRNGAYVLTMDGLRAAGTAKHKRSPDIIRMLAIGRRTH